MPEVDYIPLFALLGSQLTNDQVTAIADELASESKPESADAIRKAITGVTDHKATDADVNRVRARLAADGWPRADPKQPTRCVTVRATGSMTRRLTVPQKPSGQVALTPIVNLAVSAMAAVSSVMRS